MDDRRPIAARNLGWFRVAASSLARAGVSANAISCLSVVFGVAAGAALFFTARRPEWACALWIAAASLVQLRLLANLFDGMVALETHTASKVGELYNEVPDRLSDTAVLVGLGYAAGGHVLWGYGAALAAMFTAYVRTTGRAAGAPMDFCGPMAKQHRMFLVTVVAIFCAAAPPEWRTIPAPPMGVPEAALLVVTAGSILTALRRLWRIGRALRATP